MKTRKPKITERVVFKLISMPCCGHLLCWVNPRWPTYCPTCGKSILAYVKQGVLHSDDEAELTYNA